MKISDNILAIINNSPEAIIKRIAERVKARRLEMDLTQAALAKRAGIPLPTYRRFERTGEISLRALVTLATAMSATAEFATLFTTKSYSSMDDLLSAGDKPRQRGKRNG